MAHIGFKTRHGTKTSLVLGSLTDLRLVVTFEPFPASKTKTVKNRSRYQKYLGDTTAAAKFNEYLKN